MKSRTISIVRVCHFTEKAKALFEKIKSSMPEIEWASIDSSKELSPWIKESFEKSLPLLFISAAGIAVRMTSPFIKDKFTDSPVLVMDEDGKFVIPILSGHLGNGNEIAKLIAGKMNAQPVITTATDLNDKFSVDNLAKLNGFRIVNRDGIKKVSSKILAGEKIKLYVDKSISVNENNIPKEIVLLKELDAKEAVDVLISTKEMSAKKSNFLINLVPKKYCLGFGCKKGKSFEDLRNYAESIFTDALHADLRNDIHSVASINIKERETGLMELAHYLHVPFMTFTSEELLDAEGDFTESEFVQQVTGVSNVCERAAVLAAGKLKKLAVKKTTDNGMALSIAERIPEIRIWKEDQKEN